jgi:hypothetical protein
MASGIVLMAGATASAFFIFALNRAVKMKEDKRPLAELLWVACGLIPLASVCLIWAATEGTTLSAKIVIFVVGAAIGGFGLVGISQWLAPTTPASAQEPGTTNPPAPPPTQRTYPPVVLDLGKNTRIEHSLIAGPGTGIESRGEGLTLHETDIFQVPPSANPAKDK